MIPRTTSSRWLAGAAVVVALLVVSSLVIAVLNRDREPDLLPAGSPERAVQDYILAAQREDAHAAYELLSEEARGWCGPEDLSLGSRYFRRPDETFSVRLVETEEDGDEAKVTIEVTWVEAPGDIPLLGGSVSDYDPVYRLVRERGEWRLRHFGWPAWYCPEKLTPTPPATTTAEEP